jgi:hypothetical protein
MRFEKTPEYHNGGKEVYERILELMASNLDILYALPSDLLSVSGFEYIDVDPTGHTIPTALLTAQSHYRFTQLQQITGVRQLELEATIRFIRSLYRHLDEAWTAVTIWPAGYNSRTPMISMVDVFRDEETAKRVLEIATRLHADIRADTARRARGGDRQAAQKLKEIKKRGEIRYEVRRLW